MGVISRMERRSPPNGADYWYGPILHPTSAGVEVDAETSLGSTAVWNAVTIITSALAVLPLKLYRRRRDGGRDEARDDPRYWLVFRKPNQWQTAFTWREMAQGHLLLRGNAFAQKVEDRLGRVRELVPLHPTRITIKVTDTGDVLYELQRGDGTRRLFRRDEIFHIHGLSSNGYWGYSPVTVHREALGTSLATDRYAGRFFGNNAEPGGVIRAQGKLQDDAFKRLKREWQDAHSGANQHKVAILEQGMEWQQVGFNAEDAQLIQSRSFNVVEAARIFNIPPHKLKELSRATFSNIEQQSIEFVVDTVQPWAERWEQQLDADLLKDGERETLYFKFELSALLRGDTAARGQFYQSLFNMGSISPNEIRALEELNPIEGGDRYFVQLNLVPLDMADRVVTAEIVGEPPPEDSGEAERALPAARKALGPSREERAQRSLTARRRHMDAFERLLTEAAGRVSAREVTQVKRAVKKAFEGQGAQDVLVWIDEFYDEHGQFMAGVQRQFLPVLAAFAVAIAEAAADEVAMPAPDIARFVRQYTHALATRWSISSSRQLKAVIRTFDGEDLAAAIEERADEWAATRPGKTGRREAEQGGNAFARAAYHAVGVLQLRWIAAGSETCPICSEMDGRTVGIEEPFVEEGQTVAEGSQAPLTVERVVTHPPLHDGCVCMVAAA